MSAYYKLENTISKRVEVYEGKQYLGVAWSKQNTQTRYCTEEQMVKIVEFISNNSSYDEPKYAVPPLTEIKRR